MPHRPSHSLLLRRMLSLRRLGSARPGAWCDANPLQEQPRHSHSLPQVQEWRQRGRYWGTLLTLTLSISSLMRVDIIQKYKHSTQNIFERFKTLSTLDYIAFWGLNFLIPSLLALVNKFENELFFLSLVIPLTQFRLSFNT